MRLPNVLRKLFARLFSRRSLGGFPVLDPLRRPCPARPRFRPALEMLELRMMPTVTATYTSASKLFVVDANSSTTVTAMTVTGDATQIILTLTGDTFTKAGDAASGFYSDNFVLSNGNATLTLNYASFPSVPVTNFNILQRSNQESLTLSLGLNSFSSPPTNFNITGTGDAVTLGTINGVPGSLTDNSGSVTVNGAINVSGAVSLTGTGIGTGTRNVGVTLLSPVKAGGSGQLTITGTGSGSGSNFD